MYNFHAMRATKFFCFFGLFLAACGSAKTQQLLVGANRTELYFPLLEGKRVGLVVNHTAIVDSVHLVDFLLNNEVEVTAVFAPEHGFRGDVSAGGEVKDGMDRRTGLPVYSLYGKNKMPTAEQMAQVDVLVFDIQDVGCRFYTYISTLHLVMEACAGNGVPLIVLDRPNPNGDYFDGPVLEPKFQSFVGMDPLPVVHGCTVGELALMINGEHWHKADTSCDLKVIPVLGYSHSMKVVLSAKPSPNLPNYRAVRLYPSLCFFEATSVSVGRGTDYPFQVLGGLRSDLGAFSFVPRSVPGALHPLNEGLTCYGVDLRKVRPIPRFTLRYFLDFYQKYDDESEFLIRERWLNLLAGTDKLIEQIREGWSEEEIRRSWEPALENYRSIRKKYLLYPDFE